MKVRSITYVVLEERNCKFNRYKNKKYQAIHIKGGMHDKVEKKMLLQDVD